MIDKSILTELYKTDPELIEKFHVCHGQGLEKCVERTYNDLLVAETEYLYNGTDVIGYYSLERSPYGTFLSGFFIKPAYRKDQIKWEEIYNNLPLNTYCGLYTCNKRAIRFFEKKNYNKISDFLDSFIFQIK